MTDDLLVFARTPRIDLSPFALDELVHRTVELCREQALASDVHVQTRSGRGSRPLIVACDAARIQSVLVNLLQNAIEAVAWSPAPGATREVLVSTQEAAPGGPAFASLAVEDSGPGVSAVAREHLFE